MPLNQSQNKWLGGISITATLSILSIAYWLFTNIVWADRYNRDWDRHDKIHQRDRAALTARHKKDREFDTVEQLKWRRGQVNNDIRRNNLMRSNLVNPNVQHAISEDLKSQLSDIDNQLDSIRGRR